MLSRLVVFCAVLSVAFVYSVQVVQQTLELRKLEPKPDKFKDVEGCYVRELKTVIPFGSVRYGDCEEYSCDTKQLNITSCPRVMNTDKYKDP